MGPISGQQDPGGPHVGPMNLAILVPWQQPILCWGELNDSLVQDCGNPIYISDGITTVLG